MNPGRIKRILTFLIMASLILSPVSVAATGEAGEVLFREEAAFTAPVYAFSLTDFVYTVSGDEVVLSGYKGSGKPNLKIPATTRVSGNECRVVFQGDHIFGTVTAAENRYGISSVNFDTGVVFRGDVSSMFANSPNLTSVIFNGIDTTDLTDISDMFSGCGVLAAAVFEKDVYTPRLSDMSGMFSGCRNLSTVKLGYLDTRNVLSMRDMFSGCSKLAALDITAFDTASVTDMSGMFSGCRSLKALDVSCLDTGSVTDMSGMFADCALVKELELKGFSTSKVTDMSDMFSGCSSLTAVSVNGFDTSSVTDMSRMFKSCSSAASISLNGVDTTKVTGMSEMFSGCRTLSKLDVSHFNTVNVTDMSHMFEGCSMLGALDISGFDTSSVNYLQSMFSGCTGLKVIDVSGFSTTNVYDMNRMFKGCETLFVLDLSGFTFFLQPGLESMFEGDINLIKIHTPMTYAGSLSAKLPDKMYEYRNGEIIKGTPYLDLMKAPEGSIIVTGDYDGNDSPSEDRIHKKSSSSQSSSSQSSQSSSSSSSASDRSSSSAGRVSGNSSSSKPSASSSKKTGSSSDRKSASSSVVRKSSSSSILRFSSSVKKSSSSTVSPYEINDSSSAGRDHFSSSSSSSSRDDRGSASSTSGKRSSSSVKLSESSSSDIKDLSSSVRPDLTAAALKAVSGGFGDIEDTVKLEAAGSKMFVLEQKSPDDHITLAKGNRFQIRGGKRGSFTTANSRYVAVSPKGLVKAKKHVAELTGIRVSYRNEENGELMVIRVRVVEPVFTNVGAKKLTMQINPGREFDIGTLIPLNASFGSPKNPGVLSDPEVKVESDGHFHITGTAVSAGTFTLPFTVNEKKFKARIRVK